MPSYEEGRALVNRFVELANQMRAEDIPAEHVNGAFMFASGVYATYLAAQGNVGYLHDSGIEKVMDAYRKNLTMVQEMRKAEVEASKQDSSAE